MSNFTIRSADEDDALAIIEARHTAIREKAQKYYSPAIIDSWAPVEISEEKVKKLKSHIKNPDIYTIVAEDDKEKIIGFGMIEPKINLLAAVYVRHNPFKSVGTKITLQLIEYARRLNVKFLEVNSSINAEIFYCKVGFRPLAQTVYRSDSDFEMPCVKMRIDL